MRRRFWFYPIKVERLQRKQHTEFIKASTCPNSIARNLEKVYKMSSSKKSKLGKQDLDWVINKFSVEVIGKKIEDFLDSLEETNYSFEEEEKEKEVRNYPEAFVPVNSNLNEWVTSLYALEY